MIGRGLIFALLGLYAISSPAAAQQVRVQSGEHATFSRLVFPATPDSTWRISRSDPKTVQIAFNGAMPDLDLSSVFAFIPKDRLRAARYDANVLELTLACACVVEIEQIPSDHIVIDVTDDQITMPDLPKTAARVPRRTLPLRLPPMKIELASGILDAPPLPLLLIRKPAPATPEAGPAQVRRHPMGVVPLIRDAQPDQRITLASICELEDRASAILLTDPQDALTRIGMLTSTILDANDAPDPTKIAGLAQTYLELGWGAEAVLIDIDTGRIQRENAVIAAALDGWVTPMASNLDPGCGPATALLSLLMDSDSALWRRVDETAFVMFLDNLPPARWTDLSPRVQEALTILGKGELLTGLNPPAPKNPGPASAQRAAHTDETAVIAAAQLLESASSDGTTAPEIHITNAQALRPSIPPGPARARLDAAIVEALVLSRRAADSIAMIESGQASADTLLDLALGHLEPEEAAEFLMRLRPHMSDPARVRARDVFRSLNLPETASRFADLRQRPELVAPADTAMQEDPWLSRDLAALAAMPETKSPRTRIAQAILERNAQPLPATDLAAAETILARSRNMGSRVQDLLDGS